MGDPITVKTSLASNILRVEVIDYAQSAPVLTGRPDKISGLGLVDAICDRWSATNETPFSVSAEIDVDWDGLVHGRRRPSDPSRLLLLRIALLD